MADDSGSERPSSIPPRARRKAETSPQRSQKSASGGEKPPPTKTSGQKTDTRKATRKKTPAKKRGGSAAARKSGGKAGAQTRQGSQADPSPPKRSAKGKSSNATQAASKRGKSKAPKARHRSAPAPAPDVRSGAILVTGICGRLGQLLVRRLHRKDRVIGVDRRPFPHRPKDVVHHQIDLRRKRTKDLFRKGEVRAVVHLGVLHNLRASDKEHHAWNVVAFQKLLSYLTQYKVPKLVVLSSANVYGPVSNNPQFLSEESPLLGAQSFRGIRDLVELDMLAQSFFWRHPETETVILRPCHILGRVHNAPSNYLRLDRPVTILGFDPMVQPIHERDMVRAIELALRSGVRGIFNIRGPGEAPLSRVLGILGKRPRPVPGFAARAILSRMWRFRLTSFPAPELDYVRFPCMVDGERASDTLGFSPKFNFEETVKSVVSDR